MKSDSTPPIVPTIVLASHQGAAHIAQQVESIQAQSHGDWRLLVRDDQSTDGTLECVESIAKGDPRIEILLDDRGRLGGNGNFSELIHAALARDADWIAISDQDDVWKPDKLARQLGRITESGARAGDCVLLHSDLAVVGPDLDVIHPSLHRSMRLRHEAMEPLSTLLIQNFVTGCSCIASRALLERATPIPNEAIVYDWWLALCAASYGRLLFEPEPTLLYRQHASNQIGAKPYGRTLAGLLARSLTLRRHDVDELRDTVEQASALAEHLSRVEGFENSAKGDVERLRSSHDHASAYVSLFDAEVSRFDRTRGLHRLGIRRQDPLLHATLMLKLLTTRIDWSDEAVESELDPREARRHVRSQ